MVEPETKSDGLNGMSEALGEKTCPFKIQLLQFMPCIPKWTSMRSLWLGCHCLLRASFVRILVQYAKLG